jgi:hypothetical protein
MFRQSVRDLVKLKKFEESHVNLKEKWCEEQQQDIECVFEMVEDLIACAIASTNSPHGYAQLQESKAAFVSSLMNSAAKYRHI